MPMQIKKTCLEPDLQGFKWVVENRGEGSVHWGDIEHVDLFKKDLLTTDVVCMNVSLKSGSSLLLNEEMSGFTSIILAMNAQWSLGESWYRDVVFPPFESCEVRITPPDEKSGQKASFQWSKSKS
jgi:hypothetical protein